MTTPAFRLERDTHGRLVYIGADGHRAEDCTAVRAFPIGAPDEGVSLVGTDGHELLWIDRLDTLPETERKLLQDDLAQREFSPVIQRITDVNTFSTPSAWTVETDRGETLLVLEREEDIRRLAAGALLITDSRGVHFRVRDRFALDKASRRLLERFL